MVNHHHKWPMLKLVRYKGKPKENGLYFGPYTSAYAQDRPLSCSRNYSLCVNAPMMN